MKDMTHRTKTLKTSADLHPGIYPHGHFDTSREKRNSTHALSSVVAFSQAKHTQRFTNHTLPEVRSGADAHHLVLRLTQDSTPHEYATEGAQHPRI